MQKPLLDQKFGKLWENYDTLSIARIWQKILRVYIFVEVVSV